MDSIASFTIETGGQKGHVMWIMTNQQGAWSIPSIRIVKRRYMDSIYMIQSWLLLDICVSYLSLDTAPGNPHIMGPSVRKPNISALASSRGI